MSFSFLASSGGYLISTFISSYLIHHLPLRYVLMIASFTYSGGSLIGTFRPPFGAMMASFIFTGFGGGLLDTAATSVIVHFEDGPLLTITYSFFSLGSMASPFLVGGLQKGSEQSWEVYFWFPFALAGLLFILQWFVYRSYKAPIEKDALHFSASRKLYLIIIDWTIIAGVLLTFSMFAMQGGCDSCIMNTLTLPQTRGVSGLASTCRIPKNWVAVYPKLARGRSGPVWSYLASFSVN